MHTHTQIKFALPSDPASIVTVSKKDPAATAMPAFPACPEQSFVFVCLLRNLYIMYPTLLAIMTFLTQDLLSQESIQDEDGGGEEW